MKKKISLHILSYLFLPLAIPVFSVQPSVSQEIIYVTSNWVPITYQTNKGYPEGLYIDILKEVFRHMPGTKLSVKFRPWKRAQAEVKKGISDFMITVATPERLKYSIKSQDPFFLMYMHIYTWTGHPKKLLIDQVESINDIVKLNLIAVSNLGNGWHKNNIENMGVKTYYAGTENPALTFLASKRADIMIDAIVPTNHLIKTENISSKIELTKARFGPLKMYLLMSKKSPCHSLIPSIEDAYSKLNKNGTIDNIIQKYSFFE